jgi:hypothetical protein
VEEIMRKGSLFVCAILVFALFRCIPAHALQVDSGLSASDAKKVYNYNLSMDKIHKMAVATSALQEFGKHHPKWRTSGNRGRLTEWSRTSSATLRRSQPSTIVGSRHMNTWFA